MGTKFGRGLWAWVEWRHARRSLQWLLGLGITAWLLARYDLSAMGSALRGVDLSRYLPLSAAYGAAILFLPAVGLYPLLRSLRRSPGMFGTLLRSLPRLELLSFAVPARLGDLGLLYCLRSHATVQEVAAVVFLDKVITFLVVGLLAAGGAWLALGWKVGAGLLFLESFLAFSALLLLFGPHPLWERVKQTVLGKYAGAVKGFHRASWEILRRPEGLLVNVAVSLARSLIVGGYVALGLRLFGSSAPFLFTTLALATAQLISFLPVSVWGLGVFEAVGILLLSKAGVDPAAYLAFSLPSRALYVLFVLLVNLVLPFMIPCSSGDRPSQGAQPRRDPEPPR